MMGNKKINVLYDGKTVGTMAVTADRKTALNIVMNGLKQDFLSVRFHYL